MQKPTPSDSDLSLSDLVALARRQRQYLDSHPKRDLHLLRQGSLLKDIAENLIRSDKKLDQLLKAVEQLCDCQTLLEEASKRQTILVADQAQSKIVEQIAPKLIQVFDLAEPTSVSSAGTSPERQTLAAVRAEVLDVMDSAGIRPFSSAQAGDPFDKKLMQVVQFQCTADLKKHGMVAKIERIGFHSGDRVLRRMAVVLHSINPKASVPSNRQSA
jgi:molecular chaperone GrpE (heat shock protein)